MSTNFEFFSIDLTTIVGTLANLLILILVVKHFLFDKINAILDARKTEVEKTYEEADIKLKNAENLESEYTERLAGAKEESAKIIKNATKKAQKRSDEIISEAQNEAREITLKANADIEKEKKRAVNQIKDDISDIAISIAEKVVSKEIDPKTHEELIDSFIENIGE